MEIRDSEYGDYRKTIKLSTGQEYTLTERSDGGLVIRIDSQLCILPDGSNAITLYQRGQ